MSISTRGKVFRDPIHGLIRIEAGDDFVLSLVNAPEFQRLRRVRQLGVSSYTYPGAVHTRFAHSLGVFNFAQRILEVLRRRYAGHAEVASLLRDNSSIVKAAALLHDIGHGPFSHMIERAFPAVADHEKKTVVLIQESGSIPSRLRDHGIEPEAVAALVLKVTEHRFLSDIVSSQLDADRMDYILRDALSTGVEYGKFDADWVINSLSLGVEPNAETADLKNLRLCLEERRGLHSAEQLVMARMHMSFQLYYHRATRGWEAHLLCLLRLAGTLAEKSKLPTGAPPNVHRFLRDKGVLEGDDWLWFDESAIEASMQGWARATGAAKDLAEMSRCFLLRDKLFLCAEIARPTTSQSMRLFQELSRLGPENIDWLLDDPSFTSYKDYDAGFRSQKKTPDEGAVATGAILIGSGKVTEQARPAESVSQVLAALGANPQGTRLSLCRLFYHRKLAAPIIKVLAEIGLSGH